MSQAVKPALPFPLRRVPGLWLLLASLLCVSSVQALTVQVLGAAAGSESFVTALAARLGEPFRVVTDATAEADMVVALHAGVLPAARAVKKPLLLLLPAAASAELRDGETAVYWAPSLTDQLRLARTIMPGLRRVGLLAGAQDMARVQALRAAATSPRTELVVRQVEAGLLVRQVAELAALTDVLLAPVNSDLFNHDSLKAVLLAAYRQNRVFIGPSPAYVRAGALASLYATPETLAADVAEAIREHQRHGHWPPPSLVSRFDVITNPQVARALGLSLPDAASLTRLLQSEEAVSWP
ncbi:MAG: hypothetical protein PSX71_02600 [bacterium]|nr:hypothetical protein [bacterium]